MKPNDAILIPAMPSSTEQHLRQLDLADLQSWAGSAVLGRGQRLVGQVHDLYQCPPSDLVAWVEGERRYTTLVRIGAGSLRAECTCPYERGGPCKHALAVVLAAAEVLNRGESLPWLEQAVEQDAAATVTPSATAGQVSQDTLTGGSIPAKDPTEPRRSTPAVGRRPAAKAVPDDPLQQIENPRARRRAQRLHRQIQALANSPFDPYTYDNWRHRMVPPDLGEIERGFEDLLDDGEVEATLYLAEGLMKAGAHMIESSSDDDGDIAMAVNACMNVALDALPASARSPAEQLVWVIERDLEDQFGLLDDVENTLNHPQYQPEHWSTVADIMQQRIGVAVDPMSPRSSSDFPVGRWLDIAVDALRRADQHERIVPLLEPLAESTGCYMTLIDALISDGDTAKARSWCLRAAEHRPSANRDVHLFRDRLVDIATAERRHDLVAAYHAESFFDSPDIHHYRALAQAAQAAGCLPLVREVALRFLETGAPPDHQWPLPETELPSTGWTGSWRAAHPLLTTLIDIAIDEQRLDDVVTLYHRLGPQERRQGRLAESVADAIRGHSPDLAIDIWSTLAEAEIAQVKPAAYECAARLLRKVQLLMREQNQGERWQACITDIRVRHKRKLRLLENLEPLSAQRLVRRGIND
ncbi:MAG: SWIM zinc finger family protein [Burkholderiaceae bacterium]